jgi:putative ATP-binding cassette transporter
MTSTGRNTWSRFVAVARPFFRSEERRRGIALLVLLVGLLLAVSGLNVVNSYVGRNFMTAISQRQAGRISPLALLYVGVFAASTVVAVYERFTEQHLGLRWRRWLTRHLTDRYLAGHAYYRIDQGGDIDNPDQRIAEDVKTFTTTTLSFALIILNSAITLCAFAGILWSITPWLFLAAVGYAAFGSLMTVLLGRRLVKLNFLQLRKEADLRYELIQVREHVEPIALQHAETAQNRRIRRALDDVVDNMKMIIAVTRNVGFLKNGYNYLTQLIPLLIVAPLYIRGQVEFGVVTQAAMAFSMVMGAFSVFVEQFQDISSFAAVVTRLGTLSEAITEAGKPPPSGVQVAEDGERVAFEHLTLRTDDGRVLVKDLSLEVPRGRRLLVKGPNAVGRTSLFRAAAGLWPDGKGRVFRPPPDQVMFLPHHPFLVRGTLREQFLSAAAKGGAADDRILAALRQVKFEHILKQVGGLDAERDWSRVLSPSEQQLLALARLLLASPPFAFLDEAPSVLEQARKKDFYRTLAATPITYISTGNDPALLEYHDTLLELYPNGSWRATPLRHAASA